jgi:hypothetical protein
METRLQELFDFATPAQCAEAINSMFRSNAALMAELIRNTGEHLIKIDHMPTPENVTTLHRMVEALRPVE